MPLVLTIKNYNLGDSIAGVTPLPIPNREVKTCGADGTACVGAWESKSLPGFFIKQQPIQFLDGLIAFKMSSDYNIAKKSVTINKYRLQFENN